MAKNKTIYTEIPIVDFLASFVQDEGKKTDSHTLIALLEKCTQSSPKMWGPSIIGFGNYHYIYASGHSGDAPVLSFSPRKNALTLYVYANTEKNQELVTLLGKCKKSKACIYVKKLADIDLTILEQICLESIRYMEENYACSY